MMESFLANAVDYEAPEYEDDADDQAPAAVNELSNGSKWRFRVNKDNDCVEWFDEKDPEKSEWRFLCRRIDVLADTRDNDGESWGRLAQFADRDGRVHKLPIPAAELAKGAQGGVIAHLAHCGLDVPTTSHLKSLLLQYLTEARPKRRFRCVDRVGWSCGVFVLPDESYGESADHVLFQPEGMGFDHCYKQKGTLAEWRKHVAEPCAGNSRLILAVSAAFAGPLLEIGDYESGGLHLCGASSVGKSTALHVAGSVWGGGDDDRGYLRTWRSTDNGLEGVAAVHRHTLLCLDEMGQAAAKTASEAAYMLANGQGKARAARSGAARKAQHWQVLFLSSGEVGLADKMAEDGRPRKTKAGQEVRLLDIPADPGRDLGLYETLNGAPSGPAFSDQLKTAARKYYGVAGREFLERLVVGRRDRLKELLGAIQSEFIADIVPEGASGQVQRAAQRFALIAAAGELARRWHILPWAEGEPVWAAKTCFEAWLLQRGGSEASEIQNGIAQVRAFLDKNFLSRFASWEGDGAEKVHNVAGFKRFFEGADEPTYYLIASVFAGEIAAGFNAQALAKAMVERGLIVPGKNNYPGQTHRPRTHGKTVKLYELASAFFSTGEAE